MMRMVKNVLVILIAVFAVAMVFLTLGSMRRADNGILGHRFLIVMSDSMGTDRGDAEKDHFNAGDLIAVRKVDPATLKAGDIIFYVSAQPGSFGATITHMIRRPALTAKGEKGCITYGTHTGIEDEGVVAHFRVLGKYVLRLRGIGWFFHWIQNARIFSFATFALLLFLLLFHNSGRRTSDVREPRGTAFNSKEGQ